MELLADPDPPTALLCMTDQLARGALHAAQHLAVAGFDDLPVAAEIGLTTVHQDHVAKGAHAARMLLEPNTAREITLPTRLVIRASTAGPRAPSRGAPVRRSAASGPQLPWAYGCGAGGLQQRRGELPRRARRRRRA